jgi:choline-sulfatase
MEPRNLLVIMSDEHNPKMLGCAGHPLVKTPHLDALAALGTRFDRAYTNCPICVPARASFATGRYVHDIGYWDNAIAYDGRVKGWGHRLQEAGICVESIGKLHYRLEEDPTGLDRQHIPMHIKDGVGMIHMSVRKQFPEFTPPPPKTGGGAAGIVLDAGRGESEYTRYDRKVAALACDWLVEKADSDEPWVLFVSFVTPHYPLRTPDEFFDLYPVDEMPGPKLGHQTNYTNHPWFADTMKINLGANGSDIAHKTAYAAYLGLCSFMDAMVGKVVNTLTDVGGLSRTRVIYTSDHGENAGARGQWGKSNHYEEASGIPMILAGAGVPVGKVSLTPVSLVDVHPSIINWMSAEDPDASELPGRCLFDIAVVDDDPDRVAFSEYHAAKSPSGSFMIRKGCYKYIHYVGFEPELFDLESDPEEEHDLSGDPLYVDVLRSYETILRGMIDPEEIDRQANAAQKEMVERAGGPERVFANLVTTKSYTPVPDAIDAELRRELEQGI